MGIDIAPHALTQCLFRVITGLGGPRPAASAVRGRTDLQNKKADVAARRSVLGGMLGVTQPPQPPAIWSSTSMERCVVPRCLWPASSMIALDEVPPRASLVMKPRRLLGVFVLMVMRPALW